MYTLRTVKFKIWGQNIYMFHIVKNYTKSDVVFFKNKHDYKCDIDFTQQFNKQYVHIKRLMF